MYRQALIIIFLAYSVSANNLRTLNEVKTDQFYPYVEDVTTGTRTCPGSCMELVNNNTKCILKKCYSWNKELNEAQKSEIINTSLRLHEKLFQYICNKLINKLKKLETNSQKKILILGLTFKENCHDYRNSQSVKLVKYF